MPRPRSILITGASSGIGAALARCYAGAGVTLYMLGRHSGRLGEVAEACRKSGARVETALFDVRDGDAMSRWIEAADHLVPLDLVIANAGISSGTHKGGGETEEMMRDVLAVNIEGTLNTVLPAIRLMRARGGGQIAIMASLAAFRGHAQAPAYCASKAALLALAEGLRARHKADGLRVSAICPGFVRTPMTAANTFPMPLMMEPDAAALRVRRGLERNQAVIAFPPPLAWAARLSRLLPASLVDRMAAR
jgi:short-subunit dehydrogenase